MFPFDAPIAFEAMIMTALCMYVCTKLDLDIEIECDNRKLSFPSGDGILKSKIE